MKNKFIIDKEIILDEKTDFLKTKIYADNLAKIIKNSEPNKVFTVGLFGNWGTGKSSIIETSKQDVEKSNNNIKFITYDAWQYVNDSFRRMFLRKLREDLKYEETDLMKKFYENESTDIGNKYQLSPTRLAFILGGLCLLLAIITFIPFKFEYKFPIYAIFTLLGLLITIISGAFQQLKISVTKPHLFAPEQFEECFKEIVSNSLSKTNKVLKWIQGDNSIQNLEKLVIVIDNMDRCSNDVAYNLLTDIKTFLSSDPYSIVFVIPVDDEALKNHILKNSESDADCEKEEFLRKFFNVTIRIKPYGETDMVAFAKQTCEKSGLNFKLETINVASKEYAKNPRRIIQLFNNLLAEKNYYDAGFAVENETLICCILIIREEYPSYYKEIVNSPKIFNEDYAGESEGINKNENLKRFLRIAQTNLGKVEVSNLSKILTNSYHQFDNIPADLRDAIDTFDTEKVLNVWETVKNDIENYIFYRFDYAVKNNFIDNELVALFDMLAQINTKFPFEAHFAKKIDEKILDFLPNIISKTKSHENLCKYALLRTEQKAIRIKTDLIEKCRCSENQEKEKYWESLFNAVLKVFQDKETSDALSDTYTLYPQDIEYQKFSKSQIEYLISNEFVKQQISNLPKNEENNEILLDTETNGYKIVKWFFEHKKNIAEETYETFLTTITGEDNSGNRMRGKTIDEIAGILKFVNPLLNLIPDRKLTTQLTTLYGLIINDRKIPNPRYSPNTYNSQQPQYINKNFIDECISGEKYVDEITEFVINIYRISNNKTNVVTEIGKLLKETNLDAEFLQLINKGYNLQPILGLIFDDDENYAEEDKFKEKDRLTLLKHCFNQRNDKKEFIISEDKVKKKLDDLLIFAQKETSNEVFALLETLSMQERYKNLLTSLIIEKDSAFVNSLPKKLLKLAINSFNKENYNEFANNFEFLSVIMQHGTKTQKGDVVSILSEKLNKNADIDKVLDLIETMKDVPAFDPNGVLLSHLGKYQDDNKDSISETVNEKIEQLKNKILNKT